MRRRLFLFLAVCCLAAPVSVAAQMDGMGQEETIVVYLVRHSERAEDGSNDPPISEAGWTRSRLLATMLADANLTQLHSTDLKRTRSTGEPTAEAAGLAIDSYDPRDLPGFAARLKTMPGQHLVLGHSNTTPQLVAALGGEPGPDIEEMEYDRLYIVTIVGHHVSTVLLRFGEPFGG
ncbi:MAG: histidine phosphatase family protein [Gemmatimonadetes bacterium]|jgi:hypothetical protein|nr:histidine phosphatase family protein [Gemmatimonadota bacterium]